MGIDGIWKMQEGYRKRMKILKLPCKVKQHRAMPMHSWAFTSLLVTDRVRKHTDILG